jgi:hypothetical protein
MRGVIPSGKVEFVGAEDPAEATFVQEMQLPES